MMDSIFQNSPSPSTSENTHFSLTILYAFLDRMVSPALQHASDLNAFLYNFYFYCFFPPPKKKRKKKTKCFFFIFGFCPFLLLPSLFTFFVFCFYFFYFLILKNLNERIADNKILQTFIDSTDIKKADRSDSDADFDTEDNAFSQLSLTKFFL